MEFVWIDADRKTRVVSRDGDLFEWEFVVTDRESKKMVG
jgi:hypothetical protein